MSLLVRQHEAGSLVIVEPVGQLDFATASELSQTLAGLIDAGNTELAVDLDSLDLIDSSGLAVIIAALKRVRREGGAFSLVCGGQRILKLLRITGLSQVFTIYPTTQSLREAAESAVTDGSGDPGR